LYRNSFLLIALFQCFFNLLSNIHQIKDQKPLVFIDSHLLCNNLLLFQYSLPALIFLMSIFVDSYFENRPTILFFLPHTFYLLLHLCDLMLHQEHFLGNNWMVIVLFAFLLELHELFLKDITGNICLLDLSAKGLDLQKQMFATTGGLSDFCKQSIYFSLLLKGPCLCFLLLILRVNLLVH